MNQQSRSRAARIPVGGLFRMLTLSVVLPLVAIQVLLAHGASPVIALTSGSCFPVIEIAIEAVRANRIGIVPLVSLASIVFGLGAAFITGNAVFAVLKDSVFTLAFGVVFLGSLATSSPRRLRARSSPSRCRSRKRRHCRRLSPRSRSLASWHLRSSIAGLRAAGRQRAAYRPALTPASNGKPARGVRSSARRRPRAATKALPADSESRGN
jgi:hypothetical protein